MAKFCAECGTARAEDDAFCTGCGARVAGGAAALATLAPALAPGLAGITTAARPMERAPRGGGLSVGSFKWEIAFGLILGLASVALAGGRDLVPGFALGFTVAFVAVLIAHMILKVVARLLKPLAVVLAILLLVGGTASAAGYYVSAPDLPPGGALKLAQRAVQPLLDQLERAEAPVDFARATAPAPIAARTPAPVPPQQARIEAALRATGLPITSVTVERFPDGKQRLLVGVSAEAVLGGSFGATGLEEGFRALLAIVQAKEVDLAGVDHVMTVVADEQGRPLVGISASTSDITAFRDGRMERLDFLKSTAFKVESRQAVIEAVQRQLP